jgi:hypothetical protein
LTRRRRGRVVLAVGDLAPSRPDPDTLFDGVRAAPQA